MNDLFDKLYLKPNLSLFEIRILNCIMFIESELDRLLDNVNKCLKQLEIYQFREDYIKIKITFKLNLVDTLLEAKFFNDQFKEELNQKMFDIIEEAISLNLEHQLNEYCAGLANVYKGILLKNKNRIFIGALLIDSSRVQDEQNISNLIKIYTQRYNKVI